MGAVNSFIDPELVQALQSAISIRIFVESGALNGKSLEVLSDKFDTLHSVELSPQYFPAAADRFSGCSHIHLHQGDSAEVLGRIASGLGDKEVLYYLNGHGGGATDKAGGTYERRLLSELQAIGHLSSKAVLLIGGAHVFLGVPPAPDEAHWPSLHQIVQQFMKMSLDHELMVINDIIAFYPPAARAAVECHMNLYGLNWLDALNCHRENCTLLKRLSESESIIEAQKAALVEKERVVIETKRALLAYRMAYGSFSPLSPVGRALRRLAEILRPRLGNLNQYSPRPMTVASSVTASDAQNEDLPLISIVTPSYRQGKFIERTIRSVVEQSYTNLEYFVQDGGSEDETVVVLKAMEWALTGWASEKDEGQSQAINRGFQKTSGEIMAWINSDDLMLPGALRIVAEYFERHPDVDVVYGNRLLVDENDQEIGRWILPGHDDDVLSWADYVPQETLFWRRRIWETAGGGVDESFRFAMDWDLLIRFREAGAKFAHIPQFLGAFRIHDHQKTSAVINEIGHREMDRIRERIFGKVPEKKEVQKAVRLYLIRHLAVDMAHRIAHRFS